MSTRTRIEFFTGVKLGYQTADEMGLHEFTKKKRPLSAYLDYARRKQRRKEEMHQLFKLYYRTGDQRAYISCHAHINAIARNKHWRALGWPNLRRAWAARSRNCARRRALKELQEVQEQQRKYLEQFGYERP